MQVLLWCLHDICFWLARGVGRCIEPACSLVHSVVKLLCLLHWRIPLVLRFRRFSFALHLQAHLVAEAKGGRKLPCHRSGGMLDSCQNSRQFSAWNLCRIVCCQIACFRHVVSKCFCHAFFAKLGYVNTGRPQKLIFPALMGQEALRPTASKSKDAQKKTGENSGRNMRKFQIFRRKILEQRRNSVNRNTINNLKEDGARKQTLELLFLRITNKEYKFTIQKIRKWLQLTAHVWQRLDI